MRVLVACEFSGRVSQAFREVGHDAWSCDLLPSELCHDDAHKIGYASGGKFDTSSGGRDCLASCGHVIGDVRDIIDDDTWDLLIAHPPCTYLAVSGARWFKDRLKEQKAALAFVKYLMDAPVPRIAIENPISIISSRIRKPDQIIQPWMFGHGETKATCLWLKNLPKLVPTKIVGGREPRVHYASPGPDRWKERSRTLQGIADAMATQWGKEF